MGPRGHLGGASFLSFLALWSHFAGRARDGSVPSSMVHRPKLDATDTHVTTLLSDPWALGVGPLAPGLSRQELGWFRDRFISSSYAPIVSHDMLWLRAALECFGLYLFALGGY